MRAALRTYGPPLYDMYLHRMERGLGHSAFLARFIGNDLHVMTIRITQAGLKSSRRGAFRGHFEHGTGGGNIVIAKNGRGGTRNVQIAQQFQMRSTVAQ